MENKIIEGEIQNIQQSRKSLTLNGLFFNSFTLIPEDIEKGSNVKITYNTKETKDKVFNNIKNIEIIKKVIEEIKLSNEIALTNQTLNTILMCAKDIQIAWIETAKANVIQIPLFKEIVKEIKESL